MKYYASKADLVGNWGILKREIFLGIWIIIFVLMTLYLLGVFRFKHDGPKKKLPLARKGLGVVSLITTIYLNILMTR